MRPFTFSKNLKLRVFGGNFDVTSLSHLTAPVNIYRNYFLQNILTSMKALLGKGFSLIGRIGLRIYIL